MAPSFDEAVERFRCFLCEQDWPTAVVWVDFADVRLLDKVLEVRSNRARVLAAVRGVYETAARRKLGVELSAVGTDHETTFAVVTYPHDSREAELLMFPSDGGLNLSAEAGHRRARLANGLRWWWAQRRGRKL